jgi:hypothetical protein
MGRFGDEFRFTLITSDPALAEHADAAGVDCIGVDIERLNKSARQGHVPNARISDHELSDLGALRSVARRAAMFARLNALHDCSKREVESALAYGATVIMIPFFTTCEEVDRFVRLVDGRAQVVLLLETAAAAVRLHEILAVSGVDEVMVGLNDLHLSIGLANPFELVASDFMTMVSDLVRGRGIRFGFGGLARAGDDGLPIPSDLVLAQHARLASTSAWISRSFLGPASDSIDLGFEIARLRDRLSFWASQPPSELLAQRDALRRQVRLLASAKR